MLPYSTRLSRIALVIFFLAVVGYAIFEAQAILLGPRIAVDDATSAVLNQQFVKIQGTATHIASLTMNGADIPVTETGSFDEPFLLAPGENRIELVAKDRYGNATTRVVTLYYVPTTTPAALPPPAGPSATTSPATTTEATSTPAVAD